MENPKILLPHSLWSRNSCEISKQCLAYVCCFFFSLLAMNQ